MPAETPPRPSGPRPRRGAAAAGTEPLRLLVLKPCCFGDVMLATPLITGLRAAYPDARLHAAVGAWSAPALLGNPDLDGLISSPEPASGMLAALGSVLTLASRIRRHRPDAVITPERSLVAHLAVWLANPPLSVGLARGWRRRLLSEARGWDERESEAAAYYGLLEVLLRRLPGRPPPDLMPPTRFSVPAQAEAAMEIEWLARGWDSQPVLALAPGGGDNPGAMRPEKRWPLSEWVSLVNRARAAWGCQLLVVGGPGDRGLAVALADAAGDGAAAWCAAGELDWDRTAAVLRRSRLLVANDSAPLHLAAALGTPTVGIYGPTDASVYAPPGSRHVSVGGSAQRLERRGSHAHAPANMPSLDQVWAAAAAAWRQERAR